MEELEDKKFDEFVSSRSYEDATHMTLQHYGPLDKTWSSIKPVDMLIWKGIISRGPNPRQKAIGA